MKKITLIILLFFFYQLTLLAQKEGNNWYFPRFNAMNFTNGTAQVLSSNHMFTVIACASISDKNGNLLFYTDGDSVWNRNHLVMTNGTGMSNKVLWIPSSSLIVPKPGCSNIYYLFISEEVGLGFTYFQYAVIDMNQSNGLGAVISKRTVLLQNGTAKITAVMHSNKNSFWVITHEWYSNKFYAYLVDKSGVNQNPVISSIGSIHSGGNGGIDNKYGTIKVSPDGTKLIVTQATSNIVELFSFNNKTGVLSNGNQFNITGRCWGLEFSASGKFLYIASNQGLYQFNTDLPSFTDINNSGIIVSGIPINVQLQIGLDKKIYGAKGSSKYLSVINYPDSVGIRCNYKDSGLYLNGHITTTVIPHFIQSYFFVPEFTASPICQGDSTHFALTDSSQIDSAYWDFGEPSLGSKNISKLFKPTHFYNDTGWYKVRLILFHATNIDTSFRNIRIDNYPSTSFTINDTVSCFIGKNFIFTNQSTIKSGNMTFEWDFGDSSFVYSKDTSHTYTVDGTYKVRLVALSDYGCADTFSRNVYVAKNPLAVTDINDSIQCLNGNSFTFTNKSTGAKSYHWDFGDGKSDTNKNTVHSYSIAGNYNSQLIANSNAGCSDSLQFKISVLDNPVSYFSVNDTNQLLTSNNFVFSNLTNCKPASSTCKYLWDFGDSQTDTNNNPTHSYTAVGKYPVLLTSTSTNGCKDTVSLLVNVFNMIVNTAFSVKDVCLGDLAYFKNTSTILYDSFMNFLWDFGDGNTIIRPNPQHMYADTGTYKIELVSLSYSGYKDTTNRKVRVFPSPSVEIIATPDSILEQGIKASLSVNGTFDSLLWSTGAITASIEVDKAGIYSIRVVDANGCDAVDFINIDYLPEKPFKVMNVITPNDDGINDYWKVFNIETYQPCKLAIYNRWGDELFSSNDYQNNWDGTYKGKKLPEGTYYFVLEIKDGKAYKGAVNILK
jgi:gliding motility-associated-like protein